MKLSLAAAVALVCHLALADSSAIAFPTDFRKWVHVKSTIIGPQHASFANNGGLHHFYANEKAVEGYRTGKFPDGSILIDDLLEAKEAVAVTTEGPRRRLAVMVKDSQRFRDSGGWGFEVFKGDSRDASLTAQAKAACLACHEKQKDRDYVYSVLRQ